MMEKVNKNIVMLESKVFYIVYWYIFELMKLIVRKMYINFEYVRIFFLEYIVELKINIMEFVYCKRKNGEDLYVNFNFLF